MKAKTEKSVEIEVLRPFMNNGKNQPKGTKLTVNGSFAYELINAGKAKIAKAGPTDTDSKNDSKEKTK